MDIVLKNFKCWEAPKTFSFPKNGLILIHGNSGSGKSSLLNAIYFAITGKGGVVAYGENKCEVILEMKDQILIKRQKGPKRLVVNNQFGPPVEAEHAQTLIDRKFGNNFLITSYVIQKAFNEFFTLTANEKLQFLESILLNDNNISQMKSEVKMKIKKSKENLLIITGKVKAALEELEKVNRPPKKELKLKTVDNLLPFNNDLINILIKKEEEINTNLFLLTKEASKLEAESKQLSEYKKLLNADEKQFQNYQTKLDIIQKEIEDINYIGNDEYEKLQKTIKKLNQKKEYCIMKKKIEQLEVELDENKREKEITFSETKIKLETELKEVNNNISKCKVERSSPSNASQAEQDSKKLKAYIDKIVLKKSITQKLQTLGKAFSSDLLSETMEKKREITDKYENITTRLNVQSCPKCKCSLVWINNKAQLSNKNPVTEEEKKLSLTLPKNIADLSTQTSKLFETKKQYETCLRELDQLQDIDVTLLETKKEQYKTNQTLTSNKLLYEQQAKKLKEALSKCQLSLIDTPFISKKKKELIALQEEIKKFEDGENIDFDQKKYDEFTLIYNQQCNKKHQIDLHTTSLHLMRNYMQALQISIDELKEKITKIDLTPLAKIQEDIKLQTEQKELYKNDIILLREYETYLTKLNEYKRIKEKVKEVRKEEEKELTFLLNLEKFNSNIVQAESLTLKEMLEIINCDIKNYIETFFEEPMEMRIELYKETKKEGIKPGISLVLSYKGNIIDYSDLSGGEKDRCSLALTLALNTLNESNIIMLDECLTSLNEELIHEILELLRELSKNKLILIVSHQIITGEFDKIIQL